MSIPTFGYLTLTPQSWKIYFPEKQLKKLPTLSSSISCGPNSEISIPVRSSSSKRPKNTVPVHLAIKNGGIKAGPFIGLLTVKGKNGKFKGNYKFLSTLSQEAAKLGYFMYVFTPEGIRLDKKRINGFYYQVRKNGSGSWKKIIAPIPDVVYNRVPSRKEELLPHVQEAFAKLYSIPNLKLFNPHYFNKWELSQLLSRSEELRRHLPPTELLTNREHLNAFVTKHRSLYLKPVRAKAGFGIICLRKTDSGYEFITQSKGKRSVVPCKSIQEVWTLLSPYLSGRDYIMQKTIHLPHYKKSPFDLRVLCQKNGSGKWSVTGIGIRHASPESITTHVPHGGKVQDPKMVMENVFGAVQSKELLKNAEITALKLAKGIETESRKLIGEMSMDLGVDRNGKIWFFEANAKPMKFDEPHIQKKSMSQILNFCAYLTC